jgi:hypothetical protein
VVQTRAGDTRALTHITFGILGRFSSFMNTPEFTACSLLQVYNVCVLLLELKTAPCGFELPIIGLLESLEEPWMTKTATFDARKRFFVQPRPGHVGLAGVSELIVNPSYFR